MHQLEVIDMGELEQAFQVSKVFVSKNYLSTLQEKEVLELPQDIEEININQHIRLFKLNKLVLDSEEKILDKLANFYTTLGNMQTSVILILDSDGLKTDFYIGAKCLNAQDGSAAQAEEVIKRAFKGNFPGSEVEILRKRELIPIFEKIINSNIRNNETAVSCVSGIPSLKNEDEENFVQGIEKLIDAMQGTVYTAIFIADPVNTHTLENIKVGYEQLYTRLAPFSTSQFSYGENDSKAIAQGLTQGITTSLSESISKTQSFTEGRSLSEGTSDSEGTNSTHGYSTNYGSNNSKSFGSTTNTSQSTSKNVSQNNTAVMATKGAAFGSLVGSVIPGIGTAVGGAIGGLAGTIAGTFKGNTSDGTSESTSESNSTNHTEGTTSSEGTSISKGTNTTHTVNFSNTTNNSQTDGISEQTSTSESISKQESDSTTTTTGSTRNVQIQLENRSVKGLLEQIDQQLKRVDSCRNFGMWNCASYFITEDLAKAQIAASTFKSLMRGKESCVEDAFINTWDSRDKIRLDEVKKYLQHLSHPRLNAGIEIGAGLPYVTPGSLISGNELAIQFGLPRKSISGLPVMSMAEFGRNVTTYDKNDDVKISLGHIYHMGTTEETEVKIDLNSLGMHTFITGSTGSGKSNTIYKLLNELNKEGVKFLVVEPAKGEYKEIFGGRADVNVFGTNPNYCPMLKINPFTFPDDVHVLEHIDRLIEIFNACWPMYAAMPAVLKEAIELAYEHCGWNLEYSICVADTLKYPTFKELLSMLEVVINNSSYSEELKNNYTGALCTRVKSLTNGLLGRIFSTDELEGERLFDENTIIDLSRVGSMETKSLITGILFIKLQEYRMTSQSESNSNLKHVTVLEEAHNLLKRTSTAQSQDGSNLQGKSVEMISNSIAEMRTYGEGFIIADQAPNLLDESVIRNTNTKIIMRLPQQEDRESVGKSASLSEKQINEIPKLKTGVAVIYQNNWMEPVLCKIDEFMHKQPLKYQYNLKEQLQEDKKMRSHLVKLLLASRVENKHELHLEVVDIEQLEKWLMSKAISTSMKKYIFEQLHLYKEQKFMNVWNEDSFDMLCHIMDCLFDKDKMTLYSSDAVNMEEWTTKSWEYLQNFIENNSLFELNQSLVQCLLSSKAKEDLNFKDFYFKWIDESRKEMTKII